MVIPGKSNEVIQKWEVFKPQKKNEKKQISEETLRGITTISAGALGIVGLATGLMTLPVIAPVGLLAIGGIEIVNSIFDKNKYWKAFFKEVGVMNNSGEIPMLLSEKNTYYGRCLTFNCPMGIGLPDFVKQIEKIKTFMNCQEIQIQYNNYLIFIHLFEKKLEKEYKFELMNPKGKLGIVLGYSLKGIEKIDLADPKIVHLLITGITGSGKSNFINGILLGFLLNHSPQELKLHIADMKGGYELTEFENCRHTEHFCSNKMEAIKMWLYLKCLMEQRAKLFKECRVKNLKKYNEKFKDKQLPHHIVVVDEFNVYAKAKKSDTALQVIELLSAQARSAGIHLIICTQTPYKELINGFIQNNIPTKIAFRSIDNIASKVATGREHTKVEELEGNGHGKVFLSNGEGIEFRAMNLDDDDGEKISNMLKEVYRKEGEEIEKEYKGELIINVEDSIEEANQGAEEEVEETKENKKEEIKKEYKKPKKEPKKIKKEPIVEKVENQGEIKDLDFVEKL